MFPGFTDKHSGIKIVILVPMKDLELALDIFSNIEG